MKIVQTPLSGLYTVDTDLKVDERGSFARAYCAQEFAQAGLKLPVVQCNLATTNTKGTLRGLHFQAAPHAETKLVRCVKGAVFDISVDMRPDSPTYHAWFGVELSEQNQKAVYIPPGIAHGYLTLTDDVSFYYMVSESYHPESERGVRWDDPALGITLPITPTIITKKDQSWPNV